MPHALEIFGGATPRMLSCHRLPSYLYPSHHIPSFHGAYSPKRDDDDETCRRRRRARFSPGRRGSHGRRRGQVPRDECRVEHGGRQAVRPGCRRRILEASALGRLLLLLEDLQPAQPRPRQPQARQLRHPRRRGHWRRGLHQRQRHPPQCPVRRRLLWRRQDRGIGSRAGGGVLLTAVHCFIRRVSGCWGAVPRGNARVAVGRAGPGERRPRRGHRRLRATEGGLRAGALGEAGAGGPVGSGVRRHGEVLGLLRLAQARLRRAAQRQAERWILRRFLRADSGEERAAAVAGIQGQIRSLMWCWCTYRCT
jgi:hypothetical protein